MRVFTVADDREIIDLVYYHEKSVDDAAQILSILFGRELGNGAAQHLALVLLLQGNLYIVCRVGISITSFNSA